MEKELLYGWMAKNILENMLRIKNKGQEHFIGLMADITLENGTMANNMGMEN